MQGFELQEGDCGVQPVPYGDHWSLSSGGTYYFNTWLYYRSDSYKCVFVDKTHIFNITEGTEISWYESGKYHSVCLKRLSDDGELLCQRNSAAVYVPQERQFSSSELSTIMGETFYIAIADESSAGWGSFQLDNLKVLGNLDFSTFHNSKFSYKMTYDIMRM